ncbi:MAG: CoB--CoM heterodisulfide reductase iron-sulfur subunit A family protein [Calditrichaeota bacterium]|nr:CoB--CoM heterodisulfide reductase iron-sulfur subunit A family protein [Calditrichota bacterium]
MSDKRRIGVYTCHCGGNISDYVDVEQVRDAVKDDPEVVISKNVMFACSDATQQEIIEDIKKEKLDGLVVASCSPMLHLQTFKAVARRANLNPYQYTQVNLREQCSWTHRNDMEKATEKGIKLVRAGIARTRLTEPLTNIRIETKPKTLVIGAGVAGLRAALALADLGLAVFIVEKESEVGGWTKKWGKMFPDNRLGNDTIEYLLAQVKQRENITLFTDAELIEKGGNVGDFSIKIRVKEGETVSLDVGAIIVASGFDSYEPFDGEYGYGLQGVVTLPQFKEMVDKSNGSLNFNGRQVKNIAYIYCVGSRQPEDGNLENPNLYCSRYCCSAAVHIASCVADVDPGIKQYHLYRDMRTYGKYEVMFENAGKKKSLFIRFDDESPPPEVKESNGALIVKVNDALDGGEEIEIGVDLTVLVTGMTPRKNDDLTNVLKIPIGLDGFYNEIHPKLRPVETVVDGVFISGASQGPKTLAESVTSSLSAVSKSAALLMKGYVDLEPFIAEVDTDRCIWCGECEKSCPYRAIEKVVCDTKEVATIIPALCKGGGVCIPDCPENAIEIKGYTDLQIKSMINALAREVA